MALYVFLGGISSGKSEAAENFALKLRGDLSCDHSPKQSSHQQSVPEISICVFGNEDSKDEEFLEKIKAHKAKRNPLIKTLYCYEEPLEAIKRQAQDEILILDDLSTALSCFMEHDCPQQEKCWETLIDYLIARAGDTIIVSAELGLSFVPCDKELRAYQKRLALANQKLVRAAKTAYFVIAGKSFVLS